MYQWLVSLLPYSVLQPLETDLSGQVPHEGGTIAGLLLLIALVDWSQN